MSTQQEDSFQAFKGAQAPLVFKSFKGKFIYIGGAIGVAGFLVAAIVINSVNVVIGILTLCAIWGFGYMYISMAQKKGLQNKNRERGTFIVVNKYHIRKLDHYGQEQEI